MTIDEPKRRIHGHRKRQRQPMIGPREMKLLREYVNGFELPRLKEANIRGRERDGITKRNEAVTRICQWVTASSWPSNL